MTGVSALLVIDVQTGFLTGPPPAFEAERLLDVITKLLRAARATDVPVVHTQFDGPPGHPTETGSAGWQIHPAVAPAPGEGVVRKRSTDSFHRSALHDHLQALEVTHLYVTGCVSELCVDTTCRRAITLGYEVTLVADGHTTADAPLGKGLDPASRLLLTNHVLSRLGTEDRLIRVVPWADLGPPWNVPALPRVSGP